MTDRFFDGPILNSPYEYPGKHWELDTNDNTLTVEVETEIPEEHNAVYEQFNPGGSIPTFVFGCRYSRVGNGFEAEDDLDMEREAFDKIIQELT